MSSIKRALVLGGGGFAASAWEFGLITGMAEVGSDVRNADLLVGTSAGARVALHLASGVALEELFQKQIGIHAQTRRLRGRLVATAHRCHTWEGGRRRQAKFSKGSDRLPRRFQDRRGLTAGLFSRSPLHRWWVLFHRQR